MVSCVLCAVSCVLWAVLCNGYAVWSCITDDTMSLQSGFSNVTLGAADFSTLPRSLTVMVMIAQTLWAASTGPRLTS